MSAIVSVIGKSKSGKTTIIEKLISELKSRGYRVATIKHAPMGMSINDHRLILLHLDWFILILIMNLENLAVKTSPPETDL